MSFEFIRKLPTPTEIKAEFPVPEKTATLNCTESVTDQMLSDAVTNAGYIVVSVK